MEFVDLSMLQLACGERAHCSAPTTNGCDGRALSGITFESVGLQLVWLAACGSFALYGSSSQRLTQNCHGLRESDCLIKTERRDGPFWVLTRRDFCPVL